MPWDSRYSIRSLRVKVSILKSLLRSLVLMLKSFCSPLRKLTWLVWSGWEPVYCWRSIVLSPRKFVWILSLSESIFLKHSQLTSTHTLALITKLTTINTSRVSSSNGRAPASHAGGKGIDTPLFQFFISRN